MATTGILTRTPATPTITAITGIARLMAITGISATGITEEKKEMLHLLPQYLPPGDMNRQHQPELGTAIIHQPHRRDHRAAVPTGQHIVHPGAHPPQGQAPHRPRVAEVHLPQGPPAHRQNLQVLLQVRKAEENKNRDMLRHVLFFIILISKKIAGTNGYRFL
jgi:hypothetical protein